MIPPYQQVAVIALLGGLLGILAMIPLRRLLIVQADAELPYPEGRACAEVIRAADVTGAGATGGAQAPAGVARRLAARADFSADVQVRVNRHRGREDPVVGHELPARRRDESGEPLDQGEGVEDDVRRSIAPAALELAPHLAVAGQRQSLVRNCARADCSTSRRIPTQGSRRLPRTPLDQGRPMSTSAA